MKRGVKQILVDPLKNLSILNFTILPDTQGGHLEGDNPSCKQAGLLQLYRTVTVIKMTLFNLKKESWWKSPYFFFSIGMLELLLMEDEIDWNLVPYI